MEGNKYEMKKKNKIFGWIFVVLIVIAGIGTLTRGGSLDEGKTSQTAGKVNLLEDKKSQQINGDGQPLKAKSDKRTEQSQMEVHFLDVGQADCILVKAGESAMLIDAGKNEDGGVIASYLDAQGITKLDYVIGTHPHEDHIGGLDVVIQTYDVAHVILPEKIHTSVTFEDVLTAIENKNLQITQAKAGDTYPLGGASFTVLAPNGEYKEDLNNWSVGIRLVFGSNSFVMTGDAERAAEEDMCANGLELSADVLKAGHHGSETSSSDAFLDAVAPSYAVISCGKDNQYGHPDQSLLNRLNKRNIQIFRTDEQGTVIAISDGSEITWSTLPSTSMPGQTTAQAPSEEENLDAKAEDAVAQTESQPPIVHITESGEKYHRAGCRHLKDSDIEITLEEARTRGLTPCRVCSPQQ